MSKAVLMSIQPKWCTEIADGKKTIEVRKTRPKLETPFKVYIYCTRPYTGSTDDNFYIYPNDKPRKVNGYVIGEFICDDIDTVHVFYDILYCVKNSQENKLGQMCMTIEEVKAYLGEKDGYNWHISDLKIYDVPKTLREFYPIKPKRIEDWTDKDDCAYCKYHKWVGSMQEYVKKGKPMRERCTLGKPEPICEYTPPVSRPPQSWCYVEEN